MRVIFSSEKCEGNGRPKVTSRSGHRDQLAERITCQLSLGAAGERTRPSRSVGQPSRSHRESVLIWLGFVIW